VSEPASVEEPPVPADNRRVRTEVELEKLEQRKRKLKEYLKLLDRQEELEIELFG